jgi:hypothetical protein
MIPALTVARGAQNVPPTWSGTVFDPIWQLDFSDAGAPALSIRQQPPITGQ